MLIVLFVFECCSCTSVPYFLDGILLAFLYKMAYVPKNVIMDQSVSTTKLKASAWYCWAFDVNQICVLPSNIFLRFHRLEEQRLQVSLISLKMLQSNLDSTSLMPSYV